MSESDKNTKTKKPLTDEQQDFLMDYLLDKFMREKEFEQMRKEDRYNQPPQTDSVGKAIVSANMGGMISMDQMTAPLMMGSGGEIKSALNMFKDSKYLGSLINELGGSTSSVGMGPDQVGPGLEDAQYDQPGSRKSAAYDNVDRDVTRKYVADNEVEIKNKGRVKTVNVGSGMPELKPKSGAKGAMNYLDDVINYTRTLGDDAASAATQSSSFLGANPDYQRLRSKYVSEAKAGNQKVLKTMFTEVVGDEANKAKLFIDGKAFKLNTKVFDPIFEKVSGYVVKGDTKNFVKAVDRELREAGGKLTGKAGFVKNIMLNEAQRLARIGDKVGARLILATLVSSLPVIAKAAGPLGVVSTGFDMYKGTKANIGAFEEAGEKLSEGDTEAINEIAMLKNKMNQGGMMDINKMTRPIIGYQEGTRNGTLVGDKEKLEVREIVKEANPEGIVENVKSFFTKDRNLGTIENPLPLDRLNAPGVRQEELIELGAYITTPDGITFKATPFMFDKYLGTKYVENNTFGSRDDVEVEFIPKYIEPGEQRFIDETYTPTMNPRKNGTFTEMNQGGMMDINYLTRKLR
jgi:hypothetical protein